MTNTLNAPVVRSVLERLFGSAALDDNIPPRLVEFGTSFGISTIYLAAAVVDNGIGQVFGTEVSATKLVAAQADLEEAGIAGPVRILAGDALDTLADISGPIGFVLLDGWKELCLPVLRLLEPKLAEGALVVADGINFPSMATYLNYVRYPSSGYVNVTFPVEDGMEISCLVDDPVRDAST
jgi:predicted O-methyltransferase YrrM